MTQEKAYIIASSHFLCNEFPKGLLDKDDCEVMDFIRDNKWEPFESWEPSGIWGLIEGLAEDFLKNFRQKD